MADCTLWSFFPSPDCILSSNYWVAIFIPRVFYGRGWTLGEMVAYSVSECSYVVRKSETKLKDAF